MGFGLFKKSSKGAVTDLSSASENEITEALNKSQETVAELKRRQVQLELRIEECLNEAKVKGLANDKAGALAALRRKKLYQDELSRIAASILTLESQSITLEGARMQHMTLHALSTGAAVHERLQNHIGVAKVDDLMDKITEQRDVQEEIFDALTQGVPTAVEYEDELDQLLASGAAEASGAREEAREGVKSEDQELEQLLRGLKAPETVPAEGIEAVAEAAPKRG